MFFHLCPRLSVGEEFFSVYARKNFFTPPHSPRELGLVAISTLHTQPCKCQQRKYVTYFLYTKPGLKRLLPWCPRPRIFTRTDHRRRVVLYTLALLASFATASSLTVRLALLLLRPATTLSSCSLLIIAHCLAAARRLLHSLHHLRHILG
jgi:hypothetical protein